MDDIKQIKTSIDDIKKHASGMELQMAVNQADTKEAIKGVANEVKLWVVSGIVIGLLGLSGTIVASIGSFGNMNKNMGATVQQVNVDSRRLDILESVVQKRNSGDSPLIQSADYKKD